jgi:GNAT superfamily N-acetyltransferase
MEFFVLKTSRLRRCEKRFIADHLTRPGSEFQRALLDGEPAGTIAMCLDQGEIIGWARTEIWQDMPTLESFVSPAYRRRGVAKACAAALIAEGVFRDHEFIAVFRPTMVSLAERLGLLYASFDRKPDGTWREARR